MDNVIVTKDFEGDLKFDFKNCKALTLIHSGQVGNFWKKEFLFSYVLNEEKKFYKKGVFSIFTKIEDKDKQIIKTGSIYNISVTINAKKAKNRWVNNMDIVKIEEVKP